MLLVLCVFFGWRYGWKKYIFDYLYEQLHVLDYEKYCASNPKFNRELMDMFVFLTGNTNDTNDALLKRYINIENSIWGEQTENSCNNDLNIGDVNSSSCYFLKNYIPVLKDIIDEKYENALTKLGMLASELAYYDVPRRFYTVIVRIKMGTDIEELKNDISFIMNRGSETRYSNYIKSICDSKKYTSDYSEEVMRKYLNPFLLFVAWNVLLNICI